MSEPPTAATYRDLASYMSMKDGDAAPDDVMIDADPDQEPTSATAEASAVQPEATVGEEPAPTQDEVSEAARVLSRQKTESKREKRIREITEEIASYTVKKHTAKAEADAEEQRLATLRAQRTQLETAPPTPTPAAPPTPAAASAPSGRPVPPKTEDVGTDKIPDWDAYQVAQAKFVTDTAEWTTTEAARIAREAVAAERQRAEAGRIDQGWQARVEAVKAQRPDFDAVVFENEHVHIGPELADIIKNDPAGAEVAYYLGKHIEESHRIARLSPVAQAVEYGRLKSVVVPVASPPKVTSPMPSAKPVSKTPQPISLAGPASVSSQVPTERMTLAQYAAKRNAEEAANGRL